MNNKNNTTLSLKSKIVTSKLSLCLLSFFGTGFIPIIPGTFGTLLALPFLLLLNYANIPTIFLTPIFLITLVGSSYIIDILQNELKIKDPSWIVIDEVLGISLVWILYYPKTVTEITLSFLIFRILDIIKPWPANYFDQSIKHGSGVILDDLAASVQTVLILYSIKIIFPNLLTFF